MNKRKISSNAVTVWNLLNDYQKWNIPKLCKASGLSEKEIYTAIGWLARENKIMIEQFDDKGDEYYLLIEYYF